MSLLKCNTICSLVYSYCCTGIHRDDTSSDLEYVVRKILSIRLFDADGQKWRKSVQDENLEILCVSQFTLHSTLKGKKGVSRYILIYVTFYLGS